MYNASSGKTPASERFQGWIRSFRETWGFINAEGFQGDLFVGLKSNPHIPLLKKDDIVEFEVRRDDKGKPEAINIAVVGSQADGDAPSTDTGTLASALGAAFAAQAEESPSPANRAEVDHLIGHALMGKIKSFRDPWGFINSDSFVGDLFFHRKSNPDMGIMGTGDPVQFEVAQDDSNSSGGCHAINVQAIKEDVATLVGQTVTGWVKSFKDQWGLLNSNRFDGDIFCGMKSNKQLAGMIPTQGMQVEFQIAPDEKGQGGLQALNVKLVGGGGVAAIAQMMAAANPLAAAGMLGMMGMRPESLVGARVEGVIRSFRDDWGFIISPSFQGDLFVHKGTNPNLSNFRAGDTISFEISQSSNGKCQAINVQAGVTATGGNVLGGTGGVTRGNALAALEGQRVSGQVRSFDGNWGFATSSSFQGDIFIGSKSNPLMGPLNRGDTIEFTVQRSSSNKSQTGFEAVNVQVTATAEADGGSNMMGSAAGGGGRSRSPRRQAVTMAGISQTGWVKSFKGGWGFVQSDSFDGDLFIGTRSNPHLPAELSENDQVMFQVSIGPGGKAEAIDVQVLSKGNSSPGVGLQ